MEELYQMKLEETLKWMKQADELYRQNRELVEQIQQIQAATFSQEDVLQLLERLDVATSPRSYQGGMLTPPIGLSPTENKAWREGHLEGMNKLGKQVRELLRVFSVEQGLSE